MRAKAAVLQVGSRKKRRAQVRRRHRPYHWNVAAARWRSRPDHQRDPLMNTILGARLVFISSIRSRPSLPGRPTALMARGALVRMGCAAQNSRSCALRRFSPWEIYRAAPPDWTFRILGLTYTTTSGCATSISVSIALHAGCERGFPSRSSSRCARTSPVGWISRSVLSLLRSAAAPCLSSLVARAPTSSSDPNIHGDFTPAGCALAFFAGWGGLGRCSHPGAARPGAQAGRPAPGRPAHAGNRRAPPP